MWIFILDICFSFFVYHAGMYTNDTDINIMQFSLITVHVDMQSRVTKLVSSPISDSIFLSQPQSYIQGHNI